MCWAMHTRMFSNLYEFQSSSGGAWVCGVSIAEFFVYVVLEERKEELKVILCLNAHSVCIYIERALCCYVVYRGGNGNFSFLFYAVSGSCVKLKIATPSQDCRLDFWVMNGLGNGDYTQSCYIALEG